MAAVVKPLVVRQHRPLRLALAIVFASMIIAMGTWFALDEAHWAVIYGQFRSSAERQRLVRENRNLEEGNAKLREQVTTLQRTTSLDKQTESFLQNEIRELQDEAFRLRGELAFFEGVMEAAGQAKGLDVQDIYVRRLADPATYQLKLVLTNVSDSDAEAAGLMSIMIEGRQNGTARIVSLTEITADTTLDLSYKFRNFKRFDANMQLPAGFTPQRVIVELQPTDRKTTKIRKSFDWPSTAS